jgi:hypothetical protein
MEEQIPSEKQELIAEVVGFSIPKLWFTFLELIIRPGQTISAYCDGFRTKYVSPVTYFLLSNGVIYFLTKSTGLFDQILTISFPGDQEFADAIIDIARKAKPSITVDKIEKIQRIVNPSLEFIMSKEGMFSVSFPIVILVQWLFYKYYRKRFLHHLYFMLYVSAQINILTLPFFIPIYFTPTLLWPITLASLPVAVYIYLYAERKFYPNITSKTLAMRTIGQIPVCTILLLGWYYIVFGITIFIKIIFFY